MSFLNPKGALTTYPNTLIPKCFFSSRPGVNLRPLHLPWRRFKTHKCKMQIQSAFHLSAATIYKYSQQSCSKVVTHLPHEAVVIVRLDLARVDNFTGERTVAGRPGDHFVAATEHTVMNGSTKRLLPQFQTCTITQQKQELSC